MTALDEVIVEVVRKNLTYIEADALRALADAVVAVESAGLPGVFIEAGCALGGSAIVMAAGKRREREFFLYDVFDLIPPPSDKDGQDIHDRYACIRAGRSPGINGDVYYGYQAGLYEKVYENLTSLGLKPEANNIHLVKGLYEETLQVKSAVALAHIDCDWYESVMVCLQRIEPLLVLNGILVIDDYYAWSGCRAAVNDYFADKRKRYSFCEKSRLHVRRLE